MGGAVFGKEICPGVGTPSGVPSCPLALSYAGRPQSLRYPLVGPISMGLKGGDRGPFPVVPPRGGASDGSTGPRLDRSQRPDRLGTKSPLRGCRPPPPDWRAFLL